MKIRAAAVLGALLVTACSGREVVTVHTSVSPFAVASASPSPISTSPTPRPTGLLFAVLEGEPANTIAIAGLDGYARAKQKFTPRSLPRLCDATFVGQPEAHTSAGRVFYVDGAGVVRSLDPSGTVADVTTFSLQAQQALSFAVDPSGTQLVGARMTIPTFGTSMPCQQQGDYLMDLFSATAGTSPQLGYHMAYSQYNDQTNLIDAVGWDQAGSEILVHVTIGIQNGPFQRWFGPLAHWTPQGVGRQVGGTDCRAQDAVQNSIACISSQGEGAGSVRGPDGSIQWNLPSAIYYFILLSPDATRAAYCNSSECGVAGKDGSHHKLPSGFTPTGWLDSSTVIGTGAGSAGIWAPYGEMETVSLSDPTKVNDLGFKGSFVGVVQAS